MVEGVEEREEGEVAWVNIRTDSAVRLRMMVLGIVFCPAQTGLLNNNLIIIGSASVFC